MTTHLIKTEKSYFKAVKEGRKTFEIRQNDRGYQAGDKVILEELNNLNLTTGERIKADIGYVIGYKQQENYVVFSLLNVMVVK